jgi:dethiobiotin synthetase
MTPVFVTAAGTEIGKTFVACTLLRALTPRGGVRVLKPVATGFDGTDVAASDTGLLLAAAGRVCDMPGIAAATPWRFAAPLSPDRAAALEDREVDFASLVELCRSGNTDELCVIEGIGGVMVPLDAEHTVLDWIAALEPRVLLVGGSYLGALSHTLTAAAALASRDIDTRAVVVSESVSSVGLEATVAVLSRFVAPPVFGLARGARVGTADEASRVAAPWLAALGL